MPEAYNSFEADKRRRRWWLAGIFAAVVVLVIAGWFGRSTYHRFKARRAESQAQAFLAAGDYRNALLSARQALMLAPTNTVACRVMVTLADLSHNPIALDFQRRIVLAEPTVENKLQLAMIGLRYQGPPYPLTAQVLAEIAPHATNLAAYHIAAASLAVSLHRMDEAETHFEAASKLDPTNQLYALNLAIVRLENTNAIKSVPARATLENLRTNSSLGPPALRALIVDRLMHQDSAGAETYSTQLLSSAQATVADQLQHLGIIRQRHGNDFASGLHAVQQRAATNVSAIAEVGAWMQANDLLAEDLGWLTNLPAATQSQMPVRLALANAYLQSADWHSLRDFVAKTDWGEMEFLRLALASRAWAGLGVQQVADSHWNSAVNEAGSRLGPLTTLLGLTDDWHLPQEREDLLARIVERFPRERWAQDALERLYLTNGDTAGLNRLYAKLFSAFPDNAGYKNNVAFTSLLLNTNLVQAGRWAADAYAAHTNDPALASTYAFALHRQGRTKDGLAVLQKLDPRQLQTPDVALYYGVLLSASGQASDAAPFLKIARTKTGWLPEEKRLLDECSGL